MNTIPLGKIANVSTGGTPIRDTPEYWGGSIPWVGTGEIDFNTIHTPSDYLTQSGLAASAAKLLPKGTLLMAMYGQGATRGKVGMLGIEAATNQACAAITPKDGTVEPEFLFHVLEASYTRIRRLSNVGGQDNLNTTLIREIPVPVMSEPARKIVVAAAREWTYAVQTREKLLSALERRKQGLMQQLLTGRKRLKGFKGKWKSIRIGSILNRVTRKNTSACLTALTVSAQRGLVEQGIVSTLCLCFSVADEEVTDSDYLVGLIEAGQLNRQLRAIAHEGARSHGLINVTAADFFNMQVSLPSIAEQRAVADVLRSADAEIALQKQQLTALQTQKRALMQKLLSGEWQVPAKPVASKAAKKRGL